MLPPATADGDDGGPASVSFGTDQQEIGLLEAGDEDLPAAGGPRASSTEVLRTKHFDRWTEDEFRQLARLLPSLGLPQKRSRGTRPFPERPTDRPAAQRPPLPPLRG